MCQPNFTQQTYTTYETCGCRTLDNCRRGWHKQEVIENSHPGSCVRCAYPNHYVGDHRYQFVVHTTYETCGCRRKTETKLLWGDSPAPTIDDLEKSFSMECYECKKSRIGSVIEFVRFGFFPASGHSRNHTTGEIEEGVSVYEIKNKRMVRAGFWFGFPDRPDAFRGKGRIVGWGSDGEPLVEVISSKPIGRRAVATLTKWD